MLLVNLLVDIENMREKLNEAFESGKNEEILNISQRLDKLIVEVQRRKENKNLN